MKVAVQNVQKGLNRAQTPGRLQDGGEAYTRTVLEQGP